MHILMVLTSHDQMGSMERKTGFWFEELATPYYIFKEAGAHITIASPLGGLPPVDPNSDTENAQSEGVQRFRDDAQAKAQLANSKTLAEINPNDYDAVFYPGGHGPLWDLAYDKENKRILEAFASNDRPIGAVCHGPSVLRNIMKADSPIVAGRNVTGFSNSEEEAAGLTEIVPFLVEDMLVEHGGKYIKGENWHPFVAQDGNLVTGQNPASSTQTAQAFISLLV